MKPAHLAEGLATMLFWGAFRLLPLDFASALGGGLARRVGPLLGRSRIARENLHRAFPDSGPAEIEAILRGVWDNLGRVAAEFPHLPRIDPYAGDGRVDIVGIEHLDAMRDDGRPGIFFGAHIGNWEIMALAAEKRGLSVALFYRSARNPLAEHLYRKGRSGGGVYLPKGREGARAALELLRAGGHVGMLVDQKLNDGIAVPFLGREAMTAPAPAQLALKFRCPLVPVHVKRLGGARFRLIIEAPLELPDTGDRQADIRSLTRRINTVIEGWIRAHPEQWLWLHRRWPDHG